MKMLHWFFVIVLLLLFLAHGRNHAAVGDRLIRPFRNISEGRTALGAYHLAKIIPPARYMVIIWKKLRQDRRIALQNGGADGRTPSITITDTTATTTTTTDGSPTEFYCDTVFTTSGTVQQQKFFTKASLALSAKDLAKCFASFVALETDEKGRFLLLTNGKLPHEYLSLDKAYQMSIIPLDFKHSKPIDELFGGIVQEKRELDIDQPVDTLCQFFGQQCLINYHISLIKRGESLTTLINRWLSLTGNYSEFSRKENFFLLANVRDLVDKAMLHQVSKTKLPTWEASFLGQFWNGLSRTRKSGMLWKRLRLVDQQTVEMIDQFCQQIDADFLASNAEVISETFKSNEPEKFCTFWPSVKQKAAKLIEHNISMDAFVQWVNTSEALSNEQQQIILFWLDVFVKRLGTYNYKWPALDTNLFEQIGELFANARRNHWLTLDKIERIKSVRKSLDLICMKIDRINRTTLFELPASWGNELCANDMFQYVTSHVITTRGEKRNLADILDTNPTICINCTEAERKVAFDPCGHYCVCQGCAENCTRCPVCDAKIKEKISIFES